MSLPFLKLQATGNDFIFIKREDLKSRLSPERVAELCERRFGIGADGLVVYQKSTEPDLDYEWEFFNSDGGGAQMCGNAARCASLLFLEESQKSSVRFKTRIGVVQGTKTDGGDVLVRFQIPDFKPQVIERPCGGRFPRGYSVNTGVPHCVIPVQDPWSLRAQARELSPFIFQSEFGPEGSNLTFVGPLNKDQAEAITLERGVNDFTYSCGTGMIAAGLFLLHQNQDIASGSITLSTPGGLLKVRSVSEGVELSGPAQVVYKGEI